MYRKKSTRKGFNVFIFPGLLMLYTWTKVFKKVYNG